MEAQSHWTPGKARRKFLTFPRDAQTFGTNEAAAGWLTDRHWASGPQCPPRGSRNVQFGNTHKTMTYRCRDREGKRRFSLAAGLSIERRELAYRHRAAATYLFMTSFKDVSSMHPHRELDVSRRPLGSCCRICARRSRPNSTNVSTVLMKQATD